MTFRQVDWDTCAEDDCIGVRLPTGKCWAHAADTDLDLALKRLGNDGHVDARGVSISQELLKRLLATAPRDDDTNALLTDARFDRATFQGDAWFKGVAFQGDAWFEEATFQGTAVFDTVTFKGSAEFVTATFKGDAIFGGAIFIGNAEFAWATFQGDAMFAWVTFRGRRAVFGGATFKGDAGFEEATFHRDAWFHGATFEQARHLGAMLVRKSLVLDETIFHERAQIEASTWALCCRRARFLAGVQFRVRWAQVVLDDADLAAPSILSAASVLPGLKEDQMARIWRRLRRPHGIRDGRVQLVSLRRADVSGLTVANVDLHACRFTGAHHLDRLRLEEAGFAPTPKGWRWTTRQTIAEEHHWRATRPRLNSTTGRDTTQQGGTARRSAGWYRPRHQPPAWLEVERPTPAQVAAAYRALRKGREDNKDEPGAADFYYGEMEMRRFARRLEVRRERRREHRSTAAAAATEYVILSVYWLVAGYGLRAWRALAALAVVIGLAGIGFSRVGFQPPHPSQVASWLYALQATVSLEGRARQLAGQLTLPGELLRVGLRFTGPVLLGLALLSIRGRVKR